MNFEKFLMVAVSAPPLPSAPGRSFVVFSSYFSSSYFVCTVTFCRGRTVTAYRAKNMQNVGQRDKGNNHGIIHIHIFQNFSKIFTSAKKWLQR